MGTNAINMDSIINASLGEASSEIRATFKKTVLIRQYETEVIEAETTLKIDKTLTGEERVLISAILQAQMEFECYLQLNLKGYVTKQELDTRRQVLETAVGTIKAKAEWLLGRELNEYFE